ncbi:selenocysteine-specific translation elongation factor [uncultured Thermanaerothrix sp.]|uniref:selenocysteine-specific translation elongation factor n=1 Tax=uncultured Thermanaerothrix sp. TaxID=1195149 RepID=UPI00261BF79B|nr:selenocysteine-specific translation elongation factor [uncultured Thermanaerothrix sp.]
MHVIGTAGHVDHGKSTLVAALTGTHPDRLKEEREREMTIDLGFAWLTLPNGEQVGIIDVPGHRDFIENMLAGVGGIDAALLVVAADEGVMPQTREHLTILDLLGIKRGVIVLTKIDLVDTPEWLDLVEGDVRDAVRGTVLQDAPVVRVSARTRAGLDALVETLSHILEDTPPRPNLGKPRLPIDRVFSIVGFGTIVTGTLLDGSLNVGDEVEILPAGLRGRIRGLQTHKQKTQRALPGSRTAVNITGVEVGQIRRGDVLTFPGSFDSTQRLDAQCRLIPDSHTPLQHNTEVKLFLGTSEVLARVRVLGTEILQPGEEGWVQLELRSPIVAVRGDRFILRRPSPGETIGGGIVLDPHPQHRHRRFDPRVLERLVALSRGTPDELLLHALQTAGPMPLSEAIKRTGLNAETVQSILQAPEAKTRLVVLEPTTPASDETFLLTLEQWETLEAKALNEVQYYHRQYPLRPGLPREALRSRLQLSPALFQALLARWLTTGLLREFRQMIAHPQHQVQLAPQQYARVEALLKRFAEHPYSPPAVRECIEMVGDEIYNLLIENGTLVAVSDQVVFRKADYQTMLRFVVTHLKSYSTLSVAQFRDHFQTSRRFALAFLEHLDTLGITQRNEDVRILTPHGEKLAVQTLTD